MTTSMRLGELLALRWQAISGTELEVRVALIRVGGSWSLSAPRTPKSRRRIGLSTTAQKALKRQRRLQAEGRLRAGPASTDRGLVFTDEFGEPLTGSRITERRLRPLLRREELPPICFLRPAPNGRHADADRGGEPQGGVRDAGPYQRGHHPRPLLARHAGHAGRGSSPARRGTQRMLRVQMKVRRIPRARKEPRFTLRIRA
jgi:integrase